MRLWRPARLSLAALAVVALWPIAAYAEAPGGDGGTVNVGPVSNGPVVSQGSAGYDPPVRVRHDPEQPAGLHVSSRALQLGPGSHPKQQRDVEQPERRAFAASMSCWPNRLLRL